MTSPAASECGLCRLPVTPGEPDPCFGELPGVLNACCGHGSTEAPDTGYIQFENGITIYFDHVTATTPRCEIVDGNVSMIRPFAFHEQYGERP